MFKDRLKELRLKSGLSQEKFSEILGYQRTTISAWELGRNEPSINDLVKIANFFGVTLDFLSGNNEDINLNLIKIGLNMEDYAPPTPEQRKQIEEFAKFVLKKKGV